VSDAIRRASSQSPCAAPSALRIGESVQVDAAGHRTPAATSPIGTSEQLAASKQRAVARDNPGALRRLCQCNETHRESARRWAVRRRALRFARWCYRRMAPTKRLHGHQIVSERHILKGAR
jgi:hypothetical protein